MQELEKILEEIENERTDIDDYSDAKGRMLARHWNDCIDVVEDIIRKHINDGWIPVEDERLWDILFEKACVEEEQARRIYNRLKKTFVGERSEMNGKL